jgi:hypothetical protein
MQKILLSRLSALNEKLKPKINYAPIEMFYASNDECRQWHLKNNPTHDPDVLIANFKNLDSFYVKNSQ